MKNNEFKIGTQVFLYSNTDQIYLLSEKSSGDKNERKNCTFCDQKLGMFRTKRFCNFCRNIFCGKCGASDSERPYPKGSSAKARGKCCKICRAKLDIRKMVMNEDKEL
jgi:hypothetical protein